MKQAKTLTPQELRRVLDHIATRKHSARNRAMLLITHYAGLRVAEMASLRFVDVVDAEGAIKNEIMLRPEQTKGGYARTVFISEKLKKELAAYIKLYTPQDPQEKLFYSQKKSSDGFNANTATQFFHYLYQRAAIPGASSHSGRRSFITN
ncbi:site-specific integrase [Polynucleobacter sp. 31A-FELB]|uniref:tyrosine-type recombinase/integrase n=1 Tax=Polynucleobacter sp. 31A-FELB TaxID=2689096 RepID=UPI0021078D8E|nr:site-specific integrase [Polynucleobacter sp. 31A-FELB]